MTSYDVAWAVIWVLLFFLIAGPVHECAHAVAAWRLGDSTAKSQGRITLNPLVHFDPMGGSLLAISVLLAGRGFGWAKPTPVNPFYLRGRHADSIVAAAGPLSNLVLAALFAIPFRILWANGVVPDNHSVAEMGQLICYVGVWLNVLLMIFNFVPIPPLDGAHVLFDFLDPRTSRDLQATLTQYGLLLLVGVILVGSQVIFPIARPIVSFLTGLPIQIV
ncbi:MAG TPA: site-2 protease family protein [Candidatus Limnocylindrales bacterium]|nr:site-2 protease family protein [Candidatus Limnocylindrales bacterium]